VQVLVQACEPLGKRIGAAGLVSYRGLWRVAVTGKDSAWDQRVVVGGASTGGGIIPGVVGASQIVDGAEWTLSIQHNDGSGWSDNAAVLPDPMQELGAQMRQVVRSKDAYAPGDTDPNDLVVQVDKVGPMFKLPVRPYAVDAQTLLMLADGTFTGLNGLQYMAVEVENSWGETFEDELVFDISDLGRATLASYGIFVQDAWSAGALAATQQTLIGRGVRLPQLQIGERTTVYFQVDASGSHTGKPDVEFVLLNLVATPDPTSSMRHNSRAIHVAEVTYDRTTGRAMAEAPEGTLTLKLRSLAVDTQALTELCRNLTRPGRPGQPGAVALTPEAERLLAQFQRGGRCDQRTLRELLMLICRCLGACEGCDGGPGGHGWERVCQPGAIWLPLGFDYGVEIKGGFTGQHGPLAFQDPWWKILLLIIALIAWLAGVITQIVADKTGWENTGDHSRKIGMVGASNRITTDACIIELDGSRPALQKVVDAITGEPNNQPIIGLDTVIPIDPQVALPSLAPADVMGQHVYKSGSRTGLTHGIISSIGPMTQNRGHNGTPDPRHPDLALANQLKIGADPAFGEQQFSDHGDSGSLVLSREPATMNQVVGLLHSGDDTTTDVSPIQDVLAALGLKLR
jgi:hypothetical protein